MGIINKIKEKIEGDDLASHHNQARDEMQRSGSGRKRNEMMYGDSNRDEVHATHFGDEHDEDYNKPRNRMVDTLSNQQVGESVAGQSGKYSDHNTMLHSMSNRQADQFAREGDLYKALDTNADEGTNYVKRNEMFGTAPNDKERLQGMGEGDHKNLESDRLL